MQGRQHRARALLATGALAPRDAARLRQLLAALDRGDEPPVLAELDRLLDRLEGELPESARGNAPTVLEVREPSGPKGDMLPGGPLSDPRIPRLEEPGPGGEGAAVPASCAGCSRPIGLAEIAGSSAVAVAGSVYCTECVVAGRGAFPVRGDYVLVARLGEGGMGEVFLAAHRPTRRLVAYKIVRTLGCAPGPELLVRFARKVEVLRGLDHPNIVRFLGAGATDGHPFLVMEYVKGESLRKILDRKKRLDPKGAVEIAYQVAKALEHAYERDVVHRDLKPENIMIDEEGRVRVLDLGFGKPMKDAGLSGITSSEVTLGSFPYVAPEQIGDARHADQRADIYSLGAILYEMASGVRVFAGVPRLQLIAMISLGSFTPLAEIAPDLPKGLRAVVERAMALDPAGRYSTPGEMKAALRVLRG